MSEQAFILIVEPEAAAGEEFAASLRERGHFPRVATTADEARESIRERRPDVILVDTAALGNGKRGDLLSEYRRLAPDAEMILLTEGEDTALRDTRATALRIFDHLSKPIDFEAASRVVDQAARQARHNRDQRLLSEQAQRRIELDGIVTVNPKMHALLRTMQKIADSKLTVLILGESGTGKELAARAIHNHSPRKQKSYRAINCAGFNENLLESELFGHVRGAFTGAVVERKGMFEVADAGTIFLDEVGDMPVTMQAKLLRTLENGEIQPVGSSDVRRVDVRVVAATRRDLRQMVEKGEFREDLFYRLNQATLRLPPLRERREDIPLLIDHFILQAAKTHGRQVESISHEAVRRLTGYQWPGNVRELRGVVEQMVVLAEHSRLEVEDLPEQVRGTTDIVLASNPSTAGLTMEQMERIHIANTLKLTGGNREKTAKLLGIGARTLYRKLREYGLQ